MPGNFRAAEALCAESLALWRDQRDAWQVTQAKMALGIVLANQADHERAVPLLEETAALMDGLGDETGAAWARMHIGVALVERGEAARTGAVLEAALIVFRREGDELGVGGTLLALGQAAEARGNWPAAAACYAENLALWEKDRRQERLPNTLAGVARLAAGGGRPLRAARLLGAAAAQNEPLHEVPTPPERARRERAAAAARAALGDASFDAAWAMGRALAPEEATAEAKVALVDVVAGAAPAGSVVEDPFGLTRREREVLRLIAAGSSNQQVGEALFISPRTAQTHVTHLLAKLGLPSRTAAAAFAHEHRLT